jgi:class 3 adenylate cyclase
LTGERVVRRLAAILAADVVGYSRLMGRDENGTLARLREHRKQRFEPILARLGGRLVKLMGDGATSDYPRRRDDRVTNKARSAVRGSDVLQRTIGFRNIRRIGSSRGSSQ